MIWLLWLSGAFRPVSHHNELLQPALLPRSRPGGQTQAHSREGNTCSHQRERGEHPARMLESSKTKRGCQTCVSTCDGSKRTRKQAGRRKRRKTAPSRVENDENDKNKREMSPVRAGCRQVAMHVVGDGLIQLKWTTVDASPRLQSIRVLRVNILAVFHDLPSLSLRRHSL